MIEIRGRKYRDHAHLLAEYERELAEIEGKSGAAEADDAKEPVNEDRRMLLEAIEAHKDAHKPTEQRSRESLQRLVGAKAAKDWERWHDQ